jgi:hypothetical protein
MLAARMVLAMALPGWFVERAGHGLGAAPHRVLLVRAVAGLVVAVDIVWFADAAVGLGLVAGAVPDDRVAQCRRCGAVTPGGALDGDAGLHQDPGDLGEGRRWAVEDPATRRMVFIGPRAASRSPSIRLAWGSTPSAMASACWVACSHRATVPVGASSWW